MIEPHLLKLRKRDEVSTAEESAIRGLVAEVRDYDADKTIIRRGQKLSESLLLVSGWLARVKQLPEGRQITEIHVAGDFADLHGFTLKRLDHDLMTVTQSRIAVVPHDRIQQLTERFPHIGRLYWFTTNMDAAIHREWTVSLGRRSALQRMAHLFCELLVRLEIVGLTDGSSYEFPLTQLELSECLGLTPVHVNRTLQELRRRELIELQSRRVTILDLDALRSLAEFNPDYLYLQRIPL
jgi:CRP-like cAMP-binding protein